MSKNHQPSSPFHAILLEPILTPSAIVDGLGEDHPDLDDVQVDAIPDDFDMGHEFDPVSSDWGDFTILDFASPPEPEYTSGVFTVGEDGTVGIDFLFDGGFYSRGEVGIFSIEGIDAEPGSDEFIKIAAQRALSRSEQGHVIISDATDGARFSGTMREADFNSGDYRGVQEYQMRAGDRFGIMLASNHSIEDVANGKIENVRFSMATDNPNDDFYFGQIADVTGDGNTFAFEDVTLDQSDQDNNDIVFQVRGATAETALMDEVVAEGRDWRTHNMGRALIEYANAYTEGVEYSAEQFEAAQAHQPLVGIIDTGFAADNPDIDYSNIITGRDLIDGDDNPFITAGEGNEHGTHVLGIIAAQQDNGIGIDGINDDAPIWLGRAVGSGKWAESLIEFVDAAQESGQRNAVVNLSMDLTEIDTDGNITTRYEFTPVEMAALEYARQNNVLVAVAAGNESSVMSALGQASTQFDNIITVGAAERINGEASNWKGFDRADYSNYGEGLDIIADGGTLEAPIFSTSGNSIAGMNGTSVATAQVTGAASKVWAANPDLSYRQVIELLKSTATDLNDANPDLATGAGLVNIAAAIHLAKATKSEYYDPDLQTVPTTWSGEGVVTPMERAVRYGYALKEGETLWSLAQRELGSGTRWSEITKDAEGTIIFTEEEYTNFSKGQIVYIPGNNPNPPTATPQPTPPPASAPAPQPTLPTPQPAPSQAKQDALNQFLQIFGQIQSQPWLNFLKEMFEKIYNQVGTPLSTQAPQQGTGVTAPTTPTPVPTQTTQTLAGKKILLDPGHGIDNNGFDPGATGYGTTEATENLHQAKLVAQHLRQLGAEVTVLDEPLSLAQIGQRAAGNDLFISLHQNAFNKNAQGHEVFSHPNAPTKDAELAKAINSELDAIFPDNVIPNRGTKTANFSVLRNAPTNVPAVLVESLFIDAPGMSRANVEKAATAVARGIEKFLTGNATGAMPAPSPQPPTSQLSYQSGVVNANVGSLPLNFRKDAYVGADVLGSLSKGTQFKVLKSVTGNSYNPGTGNRNDWYQIEYNGQIGYVAAYYVDVTTNSNPSQPAGFHAENFSGWVGPSIGVALRNSPQHSDKSGLAEPYKKTLHFDGWMYGESVNDIWTGQPDALWYRYWKDGKAYWVPSAYIYGYPQSHPPIQSGGTSNPGTGSTGKPGHVNSIIGLNFRQSPSVTGTKISNLPNGTNLTILEQVTGGAYYPGNRTDWYKVKVGNQIGYVAAYYVSEGSNSGNNNNGNYLNNLASWSDWQWEDSINSAADFNYIKSNPNSDIGKLYRDLSYDLLGGYFPPTGAYISDDYNAAVSMNSYHGAIDLGGSGINNQPVKSLVNGTVVMSTSNFGTLTILGEDGRYYIYKHLSSRFLSQGQTVTKGQPIGKVGTVGANGQSGVFAPHLHFEVSKPPYKYGAANSPSVLSSKSGIRQRNYNPIKTYWELRR